MQPLKSLNPIPTIPSLMAELMKGLQHEDDERLCAFIEVVKIPENIHEARIGSKPQDGWEVTRPATGPKMLTGLSQISASPDVEGIRDTQSVRTNQSAYSFTVSRSFKKMLSYVGLQCIPRLTRLEVTFSWVRTVISSRDTRICTVHALWRYVAFRKLH
jgi:hypothetical protein